MTSAADQTRERLTFWDSSAGIWVALSIWAVMATVVAVLGRVNTQTERRRAEAVEEKYAECVEIAALSCSEKGISDE
jgi:hypothetical protein